MGAYLRADRVVLTEVAGTPGGLAVLRTENHEVSDGGIGEALRTCLESGWSARQRRHTTVCVGVAGEQAFFTTRLMNSDQRKGELDAGALLEACGASHAWDKDDACADHVRTKLPTGRAYSLAAVRRDLASEVFSAVTSAGVRTARLEPGPWSLLKAADRHARPPKRWKHVVRVLLNETDALAMLVVDGRPVLWRRFLLYPPGKASWSISSAIRALQVYAHQHFEIREVCGVFLQGNADGELARKVAEDTGLPAEAGDGPGLTDEQYSLALAMSARQGRDATLDLLRPLRPPPSIRQIFPWKLAAFVVFLAVGMALVLWDGSQSVDARYYSLQRQSAAHPWANGRGLGEIRQDRQVLLAEVSAVRKFLATRILWSNYLRDLPTRLPPNACLSSLHACSEMEDMSDKKQKRDAKKTMVLIGIARFSDRAEAPKEIDALLDSLRKAELLKQDFPVVQPAEIKWRRDGADEIAMFTVLAMPKADRRLR